MKILITGSTGLLGSALAIAFGSAGHAVLPMVRRGSGIVWDPMASSMDGSPLEGMDAVIHLSGENLAEGRWTVAKKKRIRDSRVRSTSLLSRTLAKLQQRPKVMICASGTGIYGNRGDEILTEDSSAGTGFIADICREWEAAAAPATAAGIRVIHMRLGIILARGGGALAKMLTPFRLGLGGAIGNGRQFMGWIEIEDVIAAVMHLINKSQLAGPVNFVAPQAVTSRQFGKTLGSVLHRPAILPLPAMAARLVFGEMAQELLLASVRAEPQRLLADGFVFRYPELRGALEHAVSG
jgi:uncharacterized protein